VTSRLYLRWPDSLWKRLTVVGGGDHLPPNEWPRVPCWVWWGGTNGARERYGTTVQEGGYGYVRVPVSALPLPPGVQRVHEVVYWLLRGAVPVGQVLRHTCDNRRCANPWHCIAGTQGDNLADAYARGRR